MAVGRRVRLRHVLNAVADLPHPKSVLDAGCGDGRLAAVVANRLPDARVLGIDIDIDSLSRGRTLAERIPNLELRQGAIGDSDLQERFDVVVCTDVLEHLHDDRQAFEWLASRIARHGSLVVHVPARTQRHAYGSIDSALAAETASGAGPHLRIGYDAATLASLVGGTGLRVLTIGSTFYRLLVRLAEDTDTLLYQRRARLLKAILLPALIAASELERAPSTTQSGYGILLVARRKDPT